MASIEPQFDRISNPIDMVEKIATINDWAFERSSDDELTLSVEGTWTDYNVSINWREDLETLHLASAFDMKVPVPRSTEMYKLIANINEQLWLGHFDLWANDGLLMYRHGLMLHGTEPNVSQCEALLYTGLEACERYYQAFQFVVWAGKTAPEALATSMFETEGQA